MRRGKVVTALVPAVLGGTLLVGSADPAGACGGLVGENGTVELVKTTTLAAYSDGIERYVTGFEFTGEGEEVGSIIPLPDVPTSVEKAGNWTLQRLVQEVTPETDDDGGEESGDAAAAPTAAEVILETEVDALDITVLRGGGDEVGRWAAENGFLLTPDAPEVLDFYAERSPYFMAAKFDAQRAAELGQGAGDSTPIMARIPTDDPWVPLRILGLGLDADQQVEADVFLLTEEEPELLAGGAGLRLARSEAASDLLLDDLRSDERMEWVPQDDMWLSYLQLDVPAGDLDYDLATAVGSDGGQPSVRDVGVSPGRTTPVPQPPFGGAVAGDADSGRTWMWLLPLAVGALAAAVAVNVHLARRRQRTRPLL